MIAKNQRNFRLVDNVLGWLTFAIAATVYGLTIEPSASFWDCPEFITSAYKLEIGHPPGAPFFMLTANFFSQLAGHPSQVAWWVNLMNALLSALCILFLFWTITHLVRRLLISSWDELTSPKWIAIEMSGLVGALIYTFSDTFWYSAVEGEVYAYSSLFTAVVFWMILKWEDAYLEPHSDRWLVLIAYMTGLSIGVHLLNLLCLSAIVLVFYYRKFSHTHLKGSLIALLVSFVLIGLILYVVIPGIITLAGWFELLFVNVLGCSYNTGVFVYLVCLMALMTWALWLTQKRRMRIANTALLCLLMLIIGYSSYTLTVIRSVANTPMDQNSPEEVFTLGKYLARDQYGQTPLLYGQAYTSQIALDQKDNYCVPRQRQGKAEYQRRNKQNASDKDQYVVVAHDISYVYAQNMFFPRMWDSKHADDYEAWMGGVDGYEEYYDRCGEYVSVKMPTQWENLRFFLSYQCNFMYWRYFMWNFAGRQNDIQGHGEPHHGNWLTGISLLDNWRLGNQDLLPDELKENKGHNVFYALPLLLGIIGLLWQGLRCGNRGIRQFWVVFFLFFMTGLAIVIYINQTPGQPRERDYAYAGSFYAFAIWCGMGVAALCQLICMKLSRFVNGNRRMAALSAFVVGLLCLLVPLQMVSQTWDDHDRSNRFICRDAGYNYLYSAQTSGNPIILSNGDNDTFPLWYGQEVEGVRTDMRVCNMQYATTDWYIDQLMRPAYDAPGVPAAWQRVDYTTGRNDYIEVVPEVRQQLDDYYRTHPQQAREQFGDEPYELKNILKYWVCAADDEMHIIPTDSLYIKVDKDAVRQSGMMLPSDTIPDRMEISLKGRRALLKSDLMLLQMLSECNWRRPVYVCNSVGAESYLHLDSYLVTEGLADRITPFKNPSPQVRFTDTQRTYDQLMHRFRFNGTSRPDIYLDDPNKNMLYRYRRLFAQLALALIAEHQDQKAALVLQRAEKVIPYYNIPADYLYGNDLDIARAYLLIGKTADAKRVVRLLWQKYAQYLRWYDSLDSRLAAIVHDEQARNTYIMQQIANMAQLIDPEWAQQL